MNVIKKAFKNQYVCDKALILAMHKKLFVFCESKNLRKIKYER